MKVYIVERNCPYLGWIIQSVYLNEKDAEAMVNTSDDLLYTEEEVIE